MKNNKPWALIMPYVTNRAIQTRLDEVFGIFGWQNEFEKYGDNFICGISIKDTNETDKSLNRWITRYDGAPDTTFESFKGGLSASMKRAAVQFGIGRYLYKLTTEFADLKSDRGNREYRCKMKDGTTFFYNSPK